MDDFIIYDYRDDPEHSDLWRIFYSEYANEPKDLPRNTSLERAYADWLAAGNAIGGGSGFFIYDRLKDKENG